MIDHEQEVKEFFAKVKAEKPEEYEEVCNRYPIVTAQNLRTIRVFERTAGLVGFEPCKISQGEASRVNIESLQTEN